MLILTPQTTQDKNSLYSDDIYAIMLHITLTNGDVFRFTADSEDIMWKGELYQAFPFEFEELSESTTGELPRYSINVSNVDRLVESHIQQVDGGVGSAVALSIINKTAVGLDNNSNAEFTANMQVRSVSSDSQWVSFVLGALNPFANRVPFDRILKNHCRHKFRGVLCKYSGVGVGCNKTLAQCREYSNTINYGGFPGAGGRALYQ